MKRRFLAVLLAVCLLLGTAPLQARAEDIVDVTRYSYTVTPILSPFTYELYVKTDNPDPTSFRLVDEESVHYQPGDEGWIEDQYGFGHVEPGTYYIEQRKFKDVEYEDASIYRVPGGYIFTAMDAYSDGGEFTLCQKTSSGRHSIADDKFEKTSVKIPCQKLETGYSYLINTCTTADMTFFEKLSAAQSRLSGISRYPFGVYDMDKPGKVPYPYWAVSPYPELTPHAYCEMFDYIDGLLLSFAYPFVLDSLGFPNTMGAVAKTLEPDCTVSSGSSHPYIEVTFDGETHTYGGAGWGGNTPMFSDKVKKVFTFDGAETDFATHGTIDGYRQLFQDYTDIANADTRMESYMDQLSVEEAIRSTGGTWLRVRKELYAGSLAFSCAVPLGESFFFASNTWVDGRYVDKYESLVPGTSFEEHPTASIAVRNVTYTDINGETHTQDVVYRYQEDKDCWEAHDFYHDDKSYSGYTNEQLPEELILTREQVEAMDLDGQSGRIPESGLIYDGSVEPGTPFTNILVTGISIPDTLEIEVGGWCEITGEISPADATLTNTHWESSNTDVITTNGDSNIAYTRIYGKSEGTAVVTVTTLDGGYTDTCTVTVTAATSTPTTSPTAKPTASPEFKDIKSGAYYYNAVIWAVKKGITSGTGNNKFSPDVSCTRGQIVTFLWRAAGSPDPVSSENPFSDVKPSDYFYKAVLWAVENNITSGIGGGRFGPGGACTRGQAVTFLWRAEKSPNVSAGRSFSDVKSGSYYEKAVDWAVSKNVTSGTGNGKFSPDASCTRGQIVTFLYRANG